MFFETLSALCAENGIALTNLVLKLGLSRASVTHWKNGKIPKADTLSKLAAYFGVSTDYLLGNTDQKEKPAELGELVPGYNDLSEDAKKKVQEYIDLLLLQQNSK